MKGRLLAPLVSLILACFVNADTRYSELNPCSADELPCDDSQCIGREGWCDGKTDCRDGSDEKYCKTRGWFMVASPNDCSPEKHFECRNGQCVPAAARCDDSDDCEDESDDDGCSLFDSSEEILELTSTTTESYETTSNYVTTQTSRIPEISTPEENYYETTRTSRIPQVSTSTASHFETPRTSRIPEISTSTVNNDESSRLHRMPWSSTPEQSYPDKKTGDVIINIVFGNGSQQYRPSYENGIYGDDLQTSYDRQLSSSNIVSDTAPSLTTIPIAQHGPHTRIPLTHGRRSPYTEQTHGFRRIFPSSSLGTKYSTHQSARQKRNEYDSYIDPLHTRSFLSSHQHPTVTRSFFPRLVHPSPSPSTVTAETRERVLTPFYFLNNYALYIKNLGYQYTDVVRKAKQWLLEGRGDFYEWGEDTPRAIIALSLITNSFSNNAENDLMRRSLATHLDKKLRDLRDPPSPMDDSRLAIYINALLATCQDPRQFQNQDLTKMLLESMNRVLPNRDVNPMVYLTLCLTNTEVQRHDLELLIHFLDSGIGDIRRLTDRQILATTALACFQQQDKYRYELKPIVETAFRKLLQKRREDGSFGSIYTTALAAQALMSINTSSFWNPDKTVDYLAQRQMGDGSFGNMLTTYTILPVLSGRSLLYLRNTQCEPDQIQSILNAPGPKISISYTLKVGHPVTSSVSTFLSIPSGTNFFDAMKIAESLNPQFRFLYELDNEGVDIHTISGVPNDPELGYRWHLYVVPGSGPGDVSVDLQRQVYRENLRQLIPKDSDELVFWYLKL